MLRIFPGVLVSYLLCAQFSPAQGSAEASAAASAQSARKHGTIYKDEVDGLIAVLRDTAREGVAGAPAPGVLGGDVLGTARVLVAMGHCHRRYHVSDGPVVRPSLD
jgi:hypothetical protein